MDPNQQPNQQPQQPNPQPQPGYVPQGQIPQPQPQQWQQVPVQSAPQQTYPQPPSNYQAPATPQPYDANYLDSIAPPPPRPKLFSGSFGKIFFAMMALFIVAVSIIVAASGKDKTADLQQLSVRLDNFSQTVKTEQPLIRSSKLSNINTNFKTWIDGHFASSETLLKEGGVKKTQYDKKMVASEKKRATDLTAKYEDARLNATLNRVYANSMASETQQIINMLDTMSKKSGSKKIRDFAKEASGNLKPIQQDFEKYNDDGSN